MADKKEAVKETVEKAAEAVKKETKKAAGAAKKAAAKTETAAKKVASKTETAVNKTTGAAKKTAKKVAEKAEAAKAGDKIVLEYGDRQIEMKTVLEACKADYKAQTKKTAKNVQVYVKPEDNAAYYVVGKFAGKVDL